MPVPWSPIVGLLGTNNNADEVETILRLANISGLDLTAEERYSHKLRIRAYKDRAQKHLTPLDEESQRHIAEVIIREICRNNHEVEARILEVLKNHGWEYQDGKLLVDEGRTRDLDDLLPLLRRKALDRDLAAKVAGASLAEPLSVLMIDLDHFKVVNDTHGHPVGDEVLIACATVVDRRCRHKGSAYRYGGEEILALLPNFTSEEAVALAESIRAEVEAISVGGKRVKVTLSIGVATFPEHAQSSKDLIGAADGALYAAKQLGRNLVRIHGEPTEAPRVHTVRRRAPDARSSLDAYAIRAMHFTGRMPQCPNDGVPLRIREEGAIGRGTPDLRVSCPMCGLNEVIHGDG